MSSIRIVAQESVIRLTPEGDGSHLVLHEHVSAIKLSQVGAQGPQGLRGEAGEDGQAGVPEILDGGNF